MGNPLQKDEFLNRDLLVHIKTKTETIRSRIQVDARVLVSEGQNLSETKGCSVRSAFRCQMRRFESTVRVVTRVIEKELKIAVSERAAGWVEIKCLDDLGLDRRRFMMICVEFEDVVPVAVCSGLDLFQEVFVAEEAKVVTHCLPYCSNP